MNNRGASHGWSPRARYTRHLDVIRRGEMIIMMDK
jgi:hypothetical protein